MPSKHVTLEVAAFLDSAPALGLREPAREAQRRIAEALLCTCFEDLGVKPRLLDGDSLELLLTRHLPHRFERSDPLAEHVPALMHAYLEHLEESQVVPQAFEIRNRLDSALEGFRERVSSEQHARGPDREPREPLVHRAAKLGRNEPCSCGSGKKFKKCHGKAQPG